MDVPDNMGVVIPVPEVLAQVRAVPEADWETVLVRNCQAGDPEAFQMLVERYQRRVFSIAHSLIRKSADVEDVAQQVFTKVYFAIRNFDSRSALLSWIYKITVNECYDYLRKQRSQKLLCLSELSEAEVRQLENATTFAVSPDRQVELAQTVALLLEKVSPDERLLLLLKEVEGHSIQDLSKCFGWSESAVKVKLFRVRRKLARIARKMQRKR
ncbi:MAG: sigma-70 family RNA polymerase sigma factor [Acidobacteria bacterium]|nr:sigma-70 family RNA polymerase sigma factor [Acidobacteriota bacterium]